MKISFNKCVRNLKISLPAFLLLILSLFITEFAKAEAVRIIDSRHYSHVMDNYQFKIYEGEHSTWGIGNMYSFFLKTFATAPAKPSRWAHTDVYPEFSVWDYIINTDRNLSGFTVLENVDIRGFRCAVRELLPDGELFPFVNITVTKAGVDSETILLGTGNGDGVANPGESIVILVKEKETYRRTRLQFSDKYLNPFGVNIRDGDDWMPYDFNGVANKYTVPLIASDCPENHRIEFLAEYWLPDKPMHIIKKGKVAITIKGKDTTPPKLKWVQIPGDNIIQVKLYDGSKIQSVKARLIEKEDPSKHFDIELKDDGFSPDRVEADNVFSAVIPYRKFSFNRVVIDAIDAYGNKLIEESPEVFLLH